VLDVQSFRQETVILTTIWWRQITERLATGNQRSYRFHIERFNLKKLQETEAKEQFVLRSQIGLQFWKIWTLSFWETIKENIKISAKTR
jgi:hypothetical protein